jgi:sugar/nucleoside kinase (ribokinase family)
MKFDICTFGSITLDLFIESDEVLVSDEKFVFPVGDKIGIDKMHKFIGGGAANSAVGFSKTGLKTAIFGILGNDFEAKFIEKKLKEENIDTKFISKVENSDSSFSVVLMAKDGRRTIFHHRSTKQDFGKGILKNISETKAIYISHLYDAKQEFLKNLPDLKKNVLIAWNPGKTQFKSGFKSFKNVFPVIDVLILNVEEAEFFTGLKSEKVKKFDSKVLGEKVVFGKESISNTFSDVRVIAQKFLNAGVKEVVLTDGASGAQIFDGKNHFFAPAPEVPRECTLGAGDAFSVGIVSAVLKNGNLQTQIKWGTANASSVIQKFGAQNGLLADFNIT